MAVVGVAPSAATTEPSDDAEVQTTVRMFELVQATTEPSEAAPAAAISAPAVAEGAPSAASDDTGGVVTELPTELPQGTHAPLDGLGDHCPMVAVVVVQATTAPLESAGAATEIAPAVPEPDAEASEEAEAVIAVTPAVPSTRHTEPSEGPETTVPDAPDCPAEG